jgi:intraflagellar transport protein 140
VFSKELSTLVKVKDFPLIDVYNPTKPKPQGSAGAFFDNGEDNKVIRSIKCNVSGTKVAVLCDFVEGSLKVRHPDSKLYVYDRSKGSVYSFEFNDLRRCPLSVFWDEMDDRLVVCEAQRNRKAFIIQPIADADVDVFQPLVGDSDEDAEVEVVLLFATAEHGLKLQDSFPRVYPHGALIGLAVPRVYFRGSNSIELQDEIDEQKGAEEDDVFLRIYFKVMRDFIGLEEVDENTKMALIDFSFFLTLGKLDEAYRAVRLIDNPNIWENMAHMCVKTKRLDVAEVCLGNMGHARGAAALKYHLKEGGTDAAVGILAVHLGLLDDAARLFREANRYDLLNHLYQSAGMWDKAIKVATTQDRIHMKTTHFAYAKYLESIGDIPGAMDHFEKSDTFRSEIPRMLYSLGREDELEDYVQRSQDVALLKWWGAYLESQERFDKARKYYGKAKDYLSLVRIACHKVRGSSSSSLLLLLLLLSYIIVIVILEIAISVICLDFMYRVIWMVP